MFVKRGIGLRSGSWDLPNRRWDDTEVCSLTAVQVAASSDPARESALTLSAELA